MSTDETSAATPPPPPISSSLVDRVKAILITPKEEWPRIDADPAGIDAIYRSHVLPLAAIGPVAGLIGALAFGYTMLGVTYRPSVGSAVATAVVQYGLTLVGVYVLALVIDALAPSFGAVKDRRQAFKVAAYSATAGWVAGIFALFPPIAWLEVVALYSLYLLYLGLPRLMKAPADKAVSYTVVVVVAMFVVGLIISAITGRIVGAFIGHGPTPGTLSGTVAIPGAGSVDLAKMETAAKQLEANARAMQASVAGQPGAVAAASPDTLQALLPANLPGGLVRSEVSSSSAGAAGVGGSHAEGHYKAGDNRLKLEVTDMAAMGALAAMGSALNVQSSSQTATGYEKVGKVDGRMTTEKWDGGSKSGTYTTLVADRFMISAEGTGVPMDALKAAVASIDVVQLSKLVRP